MIVGNGDLASALIDRDDVTWFASGVSDSSIASIDQFAREEILLSKQPKDKHLVYFSSLCIYSSIRPYAQHKQVMEQYVDNHFNTYTIVRIGNIDWGTNPNTLLNFLKSNPDAEYREVYRHILSKKEFQYWMGKIQVGTKDIMNIPGKMVWVPDLKPK